MGVSAVGDSVTVTGGKVTLSLLGEEGSFILGHVAGGVIDFLCSLMAVPSADLTFSFSIEVYS